MRIISANLNGIRSADSKGFFRWMADTGADFVCIQEVKAQDADLNEGQRHPDGYRATSISPTRRATAVSASTRRTRPLRCAPASASPNSMPKAATSN